ncbi:Uncharacterized protein QJS10_CPB11g00229 [Acorus calamus]|uniref:Nucleotide-diphospho-sugar transferase domain-containing protein n=1 Tax=Acorus calamus TaxID=4465 RepID=A0AAV9DX98_ACOCL|nr:Uncharacterized protein QJS10_CPB11g00229 [Acorus calamus]
MGSQFTCSHGCPQGLRCTAGVLNTRSEAMRSSEKRGRTVSCIMANAMDHAKGHVAWLVLGLLLLSGLCYAFIWTPMSTGVFFGYQCRPSSSFESAPRDELDRVLQAASRGHNRTLIITVLNKAYSENHGMLDLFLRSFSLGEGTRPLLSHLLLVAVDQTAYDRCMALGLHCYKLVTDGVDFSGEEFYMAGNFVTMMWRRTQFLGEVLRRGYSYIFTDTDVMWLRNPFKTLNQSLEVDVQFSCDGFNGRPYDPANPINTGFFFVRSNTQTITLFNAWYEAKNSSGGLKEQDVLKGMVKNGTVEETGVRVRYLDTVHFGGFCHDRRDFERLTTMHANCCRTVRAKLVDLGLVLEDWRTYRRGEPVPPNPHKTCLVDSWSELHKH